MDCELRIENGPTFKAKAFGHQESCSGELVFMTNMVGYPQALTDPSYHKQMLVSTYPLVGSYGVKKSELESSRIWAKALIIQTLHQSSHSKSNIELDQWLKEEGVIGIQGIDTRELTQYLRENGSCKCKVVLNNVDVPYIDINSENLVASVSTSKVLIHSPKQVDFTVLAVDFGIKSNQINNFLARSIQVIQVPWNFDIVAPIQSKSILIDSVSYAIQGLFLSNGPGDPSMVTYAIQQLQSVIKSEQASLSGNKSYQVMPIFGICLGHQLFALAAGGKSSKMQYGNRGMNIPVLDKYTHRCHMSSQNHGFAITTLPTGFDEWFINANDQSNEGLIHPSLPWASVQFHPEHNPGPHDTEFLFDLFKQSMKLNCPFSCSTPFINKQVNVKKVLVLGSGGLSIGQAGEFDYSGSQCIKALKQQGITTILINPNIATNQTTKGLADKVYFLPITSEFVRKVIVKEKPDGIYCTFGGQTALNIGVEMKNEFETLGVKVLGTPIDAIIMSEDRDKFAEFLTSINEPTAHNKSADNLEDALQVAGEIGYPVICRAAYALGGLGSGFADNADELTELVSIALMNSPQVLLEKSFKGWQEFEYEVVRDAYDNCITVCNMENLDPLGIHTGDSIVVCPSQTLSDLDYQRLRNTALHVIRELGVVGECNIQYAVDPITRDYFIIEVNARLSRSSALASKATGYPLAFVAAQLGLNIPLYKIINQVTLKTTACFEPSLDYIVIKMPRWDLRKFNRVSSKIGTSMKSVGEVMSIGRTFEEAIQKAIRAVEPSFNGFQSHYNFTEDELLVELQHPTDRRMFAVAYAFEQGMGIDELYSLTRIDKWFLRGLQTIVHHAQSLAALKDINQLTSSLLRRSKCLGFSDAQISHCFGITSELIIRKLRLIHGITPFVKQIDTVAAEFPCYTNYLYMTYNANKHDIEFKTHGVIVLGSGVYRIGSSVEFDYCAVKTIKTLQSNDIKSIMINYNPETVSTDFDEADRLYFENLTIERVMDIYSLEQSKGLIMSMGGQSPNNIALPLYRHGVNILGTHPDMIDNAENRYKFSRLLDSLDVDQPEWKELQSIQHAKEWSSNKYPVLVRPSYVLSGAAMNVVFEQEDLSNYLNQAINVSPEFPVVITKYIENAKEIEMDAVAKNGKILAMVICEHVENAGVHSGDATLICPPQDLSIETINKIHLATTLIADALVVTGPLNIQFIAKNDSIKVIECNVRASRSFPFISKVLDFDMIELATLAILDLPLTHFDAKYNKIESVYQIPYPNYVAIKVPKFSFNRLSGADPTLGVEMASTGEVACFGTDKYEAYLKGLLAATFTLPRQNILLSIGSFNDKIELLPSIHLLNSLGFTLFATKGTADFISSHNIPVKVLELSNFKQEYNLQYYLQSSKIDLYINLPSKNQYRRPANYMSNGYKSRRMAIDYCIPLITNIKCCKLFISALDKRYKFDLLDCDVINSHLTVKLPGLTMLTFSTAAIEPIKGFTLLVQPPTSATYTEQHFDTCTINLPVINTIKSWNDIHSIVSNNVISFVLDNGTNTLHALLASQLSNRSIHLYDCTLETLDMVNGIEASKKSGITTSVPFNRFILLSPHHQQMVDFITHHPSMNVNQLLSMLSAKQLECKLCTGINDLLHLSLNSNVNTIQDNKVLIDTSYTASKRMVVDNSSLAGRSLSLQVSAVLPTTAAAPAYTSALIPATPVTTTSNPFKHMHLTTVDGITRSDLHFLFNCVHEFKTNTIKHTLPTLLSKCVMGILMVEPSTRTSSSFQAAWCKLGGSTIIINNENSSICKGESIMDTIRSLSSYTDVIVMRHKENGIIKQMIPYSNVPLISGGDGSKEHPTQALLDVYTIREELGTVNNLIICIVGDLKNGRTVHSLIKLLVLYNVELVLISSLEMRLPLELIELVKSKNIKCTEQVELTDGVLEVIDVLYVTRMQVERAESTKEKSGVYYRITPLTLSKCKPNMIVMHPLPRVDEIDVMVDEDDRAVYFRQMRYGLYVRMALLALIMDVYKH
eukprot:NODE_376_length_9826_cov_0.285288.p1 type:complete len:2007 gc:universal NODE_376_length_9826_cov_0.285288:6312-292(-)